MRGVKTKNSGRWKQMSLSLFLFLLFLLALNSVYGVYQKKKNAKEFLARMNEEARVLVEREAFLNNELQKLETEEGLKFEIKKKLNVAEVGESVAIIVPEPLSTSTKLSEPSSLEQLKAFLKNLFD